MFTSSGFGQTQNPPAAATGFGMPQSTTPSGFGGGGQQGSGLSGFGQSAHGFTTGSIIYLKWIWSVTDHRRVYVRRVRKRSKDEYRYFHINWIWPATILNDWDIYVQRIRPTDHAA